MLTATPPLVLVPSTRSSEPTIISYNYTRISVRIWERLNGSPWSRRRIDVEDAEVGSFDVHLRPGDKYEVRAYLAQALVNPNDPPTENEKQPLDSLVVRALKQFPVTNLLSELPASDIGGTYFAFKLATGSAPTYAIMQLGQEPPITDAFGPPVIPKPELTLESEGKTLHQLQATPLLPGKRYFATVYVSNAQGDWQFFTLDIHTKQRTVSIQFKELVILDDSDPNSLGNNGRFRFQIYAVGDVPRRLLKQFDFQIDDFTDKAPANRISLADLGFSHVVTPANHDIGISLHGIEEDGWFETDDIAETTFGLPVKLRLPFGQFKESVVDAKQTISAYERQDDDDLRFDVNVTFTVSYS